MKSSIYGTHISEKYNIIWFGNNKKLQSCQQKTNNGKIKSNIEWQAFAILGAKNADLYIRIYQEIATLDIC